MATGLVDVMLAGRVPTDADLIAVNPDVLGGTPVFRGTRVPIRTLFDYLDDNYTLAQFVECFPSVSADAARRVLARSRSALLAPGSGAAVA